MTGKALRRGNLRAGAEVMNKSFVREHREQQRRLTTGTLSITMCKIHDGTAVSFNISEAENQEAMTEKSGNNYVL